MAIVIQGYATNSTSPDARSSWGTAWTEGCYRLEREERQAAVEQELQKRRLLLIWDNFETVVSMPDPTGATPPLEEKGRRELQQFLRRLAAGGRSALIITSRTEEGWLGEVRRIEVGSLTAEETIEYADDLLAPYPSAAPRRARRAFAELLEWLDGHPLAMRLVLPHLASTEPERLLEGLRGIGELRISAGEDGRRTSSLAASITYSFDLSAAPPAGGGLSVPWRG